MSIANCKIKKLFIVDKSISYYVNIIPNQNQSLEYMLDYFQQKIVVYKCDSLYKEP